MHMALLTHPCMGVMVAVLTKTNLRLIACLIFICAFLIESCSHRQIQSSPVAAEMPCRVERYLVVNSSTGVMKVVALGPKLAKKKVSAYKTMNSQMLTEMICWIAAAKTSRMTVIMVKPALHDTAASLSAY